MNKASFTTQAHIYSGLVKLHEKGWSVLAPIGYATNILSKTSDGAKLIAGSKLGLKAFQKLEKVSEFIKTSKVAKEGLGYAGDALSVTAYAYDEYINPKSPAYGNTSKAIYGGINLFIWNVGPLEGAQYGGPVGAITGSVNTIVKGNITVWPDKLFGIDLPGKEIKTPGFGTEKNKRAWLDKLYKNYGQHKTIETDKNYRTGIQPGSGSTNFNPGTQYEPKSNKHGVGTNNAPSENWRGN
ncbi:hypothetical protein [Listeria aquatica]|uniref:hypothetical protein n=1 Tax=Listeria aquatica TaxID=1494960 RepID=UPI0031F5A452